jgi:hypothetical protein
VDAPAAVVADARLAVVARAAAAWRLAGAEHWPDVRLRWAGHLAVPPGVRGAQSDDLDVRQAGQAAPPAGQVAPQGDLAAQPDGLVGPQGDPVARRAGLADPDQHQDDQGEQQGGLVEILDDQASHQGDPDARLDDQAAPGGRRDDQDGRRQDDPVSHPADALRDAPDTAASAVAAAMPAVRPTPDASTCCSSPSGCSMPNRPQHRCQITTHRSARRRRPSWNCTPARKSSADSQA